MEEPPKHSTDLHPALSARLKTRLGGAVLRVTPVAGGYTPTRRLLCTTSHGRFFAKIGATSLAASSVRREIAVCSRISGAFMPRASHETLVREVGAWEVRRNATRVTIDWLFTTADSHIKL